MTLDDSIRSANFLDIPNSPGVYILHFELEHASTLRVGKLGEFDFPAAGYFYIGSALGPGGLKSRLIRHLKSGNKQHWHIDFIASQSKLRGYYYLITEQRFECAWAQFLLHYPGSIVPAPGFGASDCNHKPLPCAAHLVCFEKMPDLLHIRENLPVFGGYQVIFQKLPPDFQPDYGDIE